MPLLVYNGHIMRKRDNMKQKQPKFQVGLMVCNGYNEAVSYANFMYQISGIILGIVEIK